MAILRYLLATLLLILVPSFANAISLNSSAGGCSSNNLFSDSVYQNISDGLRALKAYTSAKLINNSNGSDLNCETEVIRTVRCTATYYGKGDGFESGTTACGNRFNPSREKTIALKRVDAGGVFNRDLCGKKAIVTTRDPASGTTKQVEVTITDSGSMGGKTSRRCMDLSYRAAVEIGLIKQGVAPNTEIKICK